MSGVLAVEHLAKSFGGVQAVRDVSFGVDAGELLALIGPNGAGKTTCFNMLNGQLAADAGSVRLRRRARSLGLAPRAGLAARRRPHLPDHRDLRLDDGARERADGAARRTPAGCARWWRAAARRCTATRPIALLARVGMLDQAERACCVLAYGDLKRVELAMALANEPRLLLMDEPTAGMAPKERVDADGTDRASSCASAASRCCSPSTTWTWCSPTPTASSCSTAGG